MAKRLTDLSYELQQEITGYLQQDVKAFLNLSATCGFYRSLLTPHTFRTITLRSTETCGKSVLIIANGPLAEHVRTIQYIGCNPKLDPNFSVEIWEKEEQVLPPSVKEVLGNLSKFPFLDTLSVKFDFVWSDGNRDDFVVCWQEEGDDVDHQCLSDETWEKSSRNAPERAFPQIKPPITAERMRQWKSLQDETFCAFGGRVKNLALHHMPPTIPDAYRNDIFRGFLGALEGFSITIWGGEHNGGWEAWQDEYIRFCRRLDGLFIDHLTNCTSFSIGTYPTVVLSSTEQTVSHQLKNGEQLPKLQTLSLYRVQFCEELFYFLSEHLETIESIKFTDCYGDAEEECCTWEGFFEIMQESKKLVKLEIEPKNDIIDDIVI